MAPSIAAVEAGGDEDDDEDDEDDDADDNAEPRGPRRAFPTTIQLVLERADGCVAPLATFDLDQVSGL
jgi:hypothetical protein